MYKSDGIKTDVAFTACEWLMQILLSSRTCLYICLCRALNGTYSGGSKKGCFVCAVHRLLTHISCFIFNMC